MLDELKNYVQCDGDIDFLQQLQTETRKLEATLFNRRITKFFKLHDDTNLTCLRKLMTCEKNASDILQETLLQYAVKTIRVSTTRGSSFVRRPTKKVTNNNDSNRDTIDSDTIDTTTHDVTELAEVLVDILEGNVPDEEISELPEVQLDPETGRIKGKFISDNVFNLSEKSFTKFEIKLLSRGLGFVPTPEKIDRFQIKRDLEKFGRNLRLKMHFLDQPTPEFSEVPVFKPPSNWTPLIRDTPLEIYLSEIEEEIMNINEEGKNYPNLSKEERNALRDLIGDDSIVIKPADKGSAIVVWGKQDYLKECDKQLGEHEIYELCESFKPNDINNKIKTVLNVMKSKKQIDQKVFDYLLVKKPQLGRFYLLPKIHKRSFNVPGRPVISNNGTATEKISQFLDFHLKQLIPIIPHILEDTRDFLSRLNNLPAIPNGAILVSFDVVGLYPHIPHIEGIETMRRYLEKLEHLQVITDSLCKLAEIVLKDNYFQLGDRSFRQKLGTAIGTIFAPTYANIFMAGLEEKIFEARNFTPFLWLRFLDDIFCIWTQGENKLNDFFLFLNNFHKTIKFTMENSTESVNFLDVKVVKSNGRLITDLYSKPTDTHQYLHAKSCHRNSTKRAIPYGQAVRIKRICSSENTMKERLVELESWLVKRGYNSENVKPEIERVHLKSRTDLLQKRENFVDPNVITLVLTYHPALSSIHNILSRAQRHVNKSIKLSQVLTSPPRVAFRNAKTLKDRLVRSKLKSCNEIESGTFKCGSKRCEVCNVLTLGDEFESHVTKKKYKINFNFNCNSINVIYLLSCKVCGLQYVGTTTTRFRERFNQYKSNINLYRQGRRGLMQESVISHFFKENHDQNYTDITVQIIDHCDPNDKERREEFWIFVLKTLEPNGLNVKTTI